MEARVRGGGARGAVKEGVSGDASVESAKSSAVIFRGLRVEHIDIDGERGAGEGGEECRLAKPGLTLSGRGWAWGRKGWPRRKARDALDGSKVVAAGQRQLRGNPHRAHARRTSMVPAWMSGQQSTFRPVFVGRPFISSHS